MDRDGKWSTSTCIAATILGFCIGFLACHKLYSQKDLTTSPIETYTP